MSNVTKETKRALELSDRLLALTAELRKTVYGASRDEGPDLESASTARATSFDVDCRAYELRSKLFALSQILGEQRRPEGTLNQEFWNLYVDGLKNLLESFAHDASRLTKGE